MPGTEIATSTINRSYQLPYPTNKQSFDVLRLISALTAVDADVAALISSLAAKANLLSPAFAGIPTAPTAASSDDSNQLATTAFVQDLLAAFDTTGFAPITNPTFLGDPKAPTRTPGDNTTSIATTAFVEAVRVALINGAPAGLNTFDEVAAAIGDDPAYAANATASLNAAISMIPTWFTGMELANNSGTPLQYIDIKVGAVKSGLLSGALAATMTKQANAVWAAGNNAGFLESAPKQASKTYFVYCLRKTSDGSLDYIASLSTTEAGVAVPSGYVMMTRVGIFLTDASNNNLAFTQVGNIVIRPSTQCYSSTASAAQALFVLPSCPLGISVDALLDIQASGQQNSDNITSWGHAADPNGLAVFNRCWGPTGVNSNGTLSSAGRVRTNAAAQVYRSISIVGTSTAVGFIRGWVDYQCRRIGG